MSIIVGLLSNYLNLVLLWMEWVDTIVHAGEAKTLPPEMRLGSQCDPGEWPTTFPILPKSPRQAG